MVNSKPVLGVKTSNSGVVSRYQVDEFTDSWSVEYFIAG